MKKRVSEALFFPTRHPRESALRDALAAIDSVHVDGALPSIPVKFTEKRVPLGNYDGASITISEHTPVPRITLIHEIAHFLAQAVSEFRAEWWSAVRKSDVFKALNRRCLSHGMDAPPHLAQELKYLQDDRELWARSYSQFIVVQSQQPELRREFEAKRYSYPGEYWEDRDFAPISLRLVELVKRKGWEL